MIKTPDQMEDADIRAAIAAVAAHAAARYKRQLIQRIAEDITPEISQARLSGKPIDTTDLFLRLAEKYAN